MTTPFLPSIRDLDQLALELARVGGEVGFAGAGLQTRNEGQHYHRGEQQLVVHATPPSRYRLSVAKPQAATAK
jgi:hypothetical protein